MNDQPKILIFKKGNKVSYGQDFGFHQGMPYDVVFTVESFSDNSYRLVGEGYGGKKYGNGAIYVSKEAFKEDDLVRTPSKPVKQEEWRSILVKKINELPRHSEWNSPGGYDKRTEYIKLKDVLTLLKYETKSKG